MWLCISLSVFYFGMLRESIELGLRMRDVEIMITVYENSDRGMVDIFIRSIKKETSVVRKYERRKKKQ